MSKFAVPTPGSVITVTTRYADAYYKSDKDYKDTTYENVPVLPPQSWTKQGSFCIPAEGEPFIKFRTIAIDKVIALEVHEGETAPVDLNIGTHYVPVQGSGDKIYSVVVVDGVAKSCDCIGFTYHGHCRHQRIATGEHPVNPRRETVKKQKRKTAAAKRKTHVNKGSKADLVRGFIHERKAAMAVDKFGWACADVENQVKQWCITDAIEKLGMSRSLATTYVNNNWSKM